MKRARLHRGNVYLRLLRRPEIAALWLGQLASVIGDRLYAMTLLWLVLQSTGSTWAVAIVAAAETAPLLVVATIGGRVIRLAEDLHRLAFIDLGRIVLALSIPVFWSSGDVPLVPLTVVAATLATLDGVFSPALQATLTGFSHNDAETRGLLGLLDSTDRVARILGPGSAGLLLAVLPAVDLFAVNAATFAVSALCLLAAHRLKPTMRMIPSTEPLTKWVGVAALRSDRGIAIATLLRIGCNLVWAAFTLGLPVLLVKELDQGLSSYGLLLAAFGAGNLLGNVAVGNLELDRHLLNTYCAAWAAVGAGFLAMALAYNVATLMFACVWAGVFTPLANVSMDTHLAKRLPRASLAPVFGFQKAIVRTAGLVGTGIVGLLLTLGTTTTLEVAGTWMMLAAATAFIAIRKSRRPTQPTVHAKETG